jgi:hypothetical protein
VARQKSMRGQPAVLELRQIESAESPPGVGSEVEAIGQVNDLRHRHGST